MRTTSGLSLAIAVVFALASSPALGATREEQQGAQLLSNLQDGKAKCASLSTGDFDHIGEYVMRQMLGSSAAHDAMNRQMSAMMGSRGEGQAHLFMGQRFAGCATGRAPAAFGAMMGMMGAGTMGSAYSGSNPSSMMGAGSRGTGGMMGYANVTSTGDGGWSSGDTVMVVLMGLLLALVAGALIVWRPWRRTEATPLNTLQVRLARGEIDQQEYDRCREALGGTA